MNSDRVFAIAARKFASLRRDHRTFAFIVVMPALQILLFGLAIGQSPTGLDFAIVEEGSSPLANSVIESLESSETFLIHDEFESSADARGGIETGELWGALVVTGEGGLELHLDNSNQQVSSTIIIAIRNAVTDALQDSGGYSPLEFADPVYGDKDPAFIDFLAPGIITLVCFMFSLILTTMAFVGERYDGTLDRVFAAGTRPSEVLLGHMTAFTTILIGQVSTVILIAVYGFDIPINGNPLMVFALAMFLGWAAMCLGMFVSSKATSEFQAMQLNMPFLFIALLLSGILWPVEALPTGLQHFSWALPTTWAAEAFRSIMIRGWGLENDIVLGAFLYTAGFALATLALAARSLRSND